MIDSFIKKGWKYDRFIITSRDFGSLKAVKLAEPRLPLSVIQPWSGVIGVWYAQKLDTKRISMNEHVMWPYFIKSMSKRGWQLSGYTMDDPVRAQKWTDYGLYAVITDHPEKFITPKI